jgi:hypothetical protein
VPLLRAHRNNTSGFANYDLLSPIESAISNPDLPTTFDEPPPPYPNNPLLVSNPPSDVFSSSAVFPAETLLNITPSPLAPVPLRHSSLYQVLKHESPTSPAQGTLRSRASSIAHALEPQARQVPLPCTPALRDRQGSAFGPPEILLGPEQVASTSLTAVAVDPSALDLSPPAQAQPPVSSATPPCVVVPAQDVSVVTPIEAHTLTDPLPEVTTHDYDTLPRLRKVSIPCPLPICRTHALTKAHSSPSAPASSARILQRGPICCIKPALASVSVIAPVIFDGRSGSIHKRLQGWSRVGFHSTLIGAQAPRVAG